MVLRWLAAMDATAHPGQVHDAPHTAHWGAEEPVRDRIDAPDERAARRTLRDQIARLERELGDAFVTAFAMGGLPQPAATTAPPRLLGLGELELVRDELADRLHAARVMIGHRADEQEKNRLLLERMLLAPGRYRFARIPCRELGEPGCGAWQVRPRLGLIGMLMGWWQVKLSSGCPLAGGHGRALPPPVVHPALSLAR
jgi:hypothetical protein